jgi:hypothetical protein
MVQIYIFIALWIIWLIKTQWDKLQARNAGPEDPRERQLDAPPTAKPGTAVYDAQRNYQEVQEEIRRRIAQRANLPMPVPSATTQPAQPRPMQPTMVPYETRDVSRPPPASRPQPVARTQPMAPPQAAFSPPPSLVAIGDMPSAMTNDWKDSDSGYPDEARAYSLDATQESTTMSALRAALASASSARHAFILREVLDRPLCARPLCSGGHDNWN